MERTEIVSLFKNTPADGTEITVCGWAKNIRDSKNIGFIAHYLQENTWKVFERKRTDIRIYQMGTKTDFYQIIIPLDKKLSDYTQAMYDATETASSAENLPLEEFIHLLLSKNCDTSADAPKNIR